MKNKFNQIFTPILIVLNIATLLLLFWQPIDDTDLDGPYMVTRVIDGDTIIVTIQNQNIKIRLIGIDTPELGKPFSKQAHTYTASLVKNRYIYLEYDLEKHDKYDRTLAYVYLEDQKNMVNALILNAGWAKTMTILPNDKYAANFSEINAIAKTTKRGIYQ